MVDEVDIPKAGLLLRAGRRRWCYVGFNDLER